MEVCSYVSDLTDAEWALLEPLIPRSHPAGRRQTYPLRRIVDAIFYLLRAGAELLLEGLQHLFPAIELMWADTAYRGLKDWLCKALGWRLSIPQHWWSGGVWMRADAEPPTRPSGFQVLARRWVVERTIAWLTTNRRLAKDYERLVETGEMLLYLAMSRILLRRLTRKER